VTATMEKREGRSKKVESERKSAKEGGSKKSSAQIKANAVEKKGL